MLEWLTANLAYSATKDIGGAILRKLKPVGSEQILAAREKWRPLFEKEIWKNYRGDLRQDVVVVNIARLNNYPKTDEKRKGISLWFRAALLDTCDEGAMLWLKTGTLTEASEAPGWRFTDYDRGESGNIKVVKIGVIPFELIENVNWQGTDYYSFPHIYCRFHEKKRQPYRKVAFYQEHSRPNMPSWYQEIVLDDPVRKLSRKLGIKHFA